MLVCEAAGYDVVIVETVGVGQSETAVANMADMFCLMQLPNAGDDLQAIKKGVMELADLVVINKADIDSAAATRAEAQITSALRLLGLHGNPQNQHHDTATWHPQVVQLSALLGQGLDAFWNAASEFRKLQIADKVKPCLGCGNVLKQGSNTTFMRSRKSKPSWQPFARKSAQANWRPLRQPDTCWP
jgi:LAO/AO transport system kinase